MSHQYFFINIRSTSARFFKNGRTYLFNMVNYSNLGGPRIKILILTKLAK